MSAPRQPPARVDSTGLERDRMESHSTFLDVNRPARQDESHEQDSEKTQRGDENADVELGGPQPTSKDEGRSRSSQSSDGVSQEFEVSFTDNDPLNPRTRYSSGRKWIMVSIISLTSLCVTCASSAYTQTYQQGLEPEFGASEIVVTLGLSLFVAGLGVGPMFLAPLSEVNHIFLLALRGWGGACILRSSLL